MDTMTATTTEIDFGVAQPAAEMVVAQPQPAPVSVVEAGSLLQVIARVASDPASDIEKMERLIAMQERMEARQAQRMFDNAMADAQEEMKAIRADLYNKQTQSNYASYAALDKAIRPIYTRHGFSQSFDTENAGDASVRIICTLAHRGGHRERRQIEMPADGKGAKGGDVMTRTHATGAATSYGQRYLSRLIWNLAVGDVDDDGNGAGDGIDDDVERLGTGPRDPATGKLRSTYDAGKVQKAKEFADAAIQNMNLSGNPQAVKEWRRENDAIPQGKKKSPLQWLEDNAPGQFLRVKMAYENNTGDEW